MAENFDLAASSWDENENRRIRARFFADMIEATVPDISAANILEYGAGTGLLGFELAKSVKFVTLADSSRGMLEEAARKKNQNGVRNLDTLLLDLEKQDYSGPGQDAVCLLMSLHHVLDVGGVFAKFFSLLNPGGVLCVADLVSEDGSFHGPGFTGHKGFSEERLRVLSSQAGFRDASWTVCYEVERLAENGETRKYPLFFFKAVKKI